VLQQERFQLENGLRDEMRREQSLAAMRRTISTELETMFRRDPAVAGRIREVEDAVRGGKMTSFAGARELLENFRGLGASR
jgi:putative protein kinase ArgK-like GTPase of G3E family